MTRPEPWLRFEAKVDPERALEPKERARRAKLADRAFMRANARTAAKARAAKKARKEAALRRRLAKPPSEKEMEDWHRERADYAAYLQIWAAVQRGEKGIRELRRHQLKKRADCALCRRPFSEADPKA